MEKADVTENGVNSNKLIFYKAAVPQRNVENRGEVCYSTVSYTHLTLPTT